MKHEHITLSNLRCYLHRTPSIRTLAQLLIVVGLSSCDTVLQYPDTPEIPDPTNRCLLHLAFDTSDMPLHSVIEYDENGNVHRSRGESDTEDFRYIIRLYRSNSRDGNDIVSPGAPPWQEISFVHEHPGYDLDCTVPLDLPEGEYQIYIWGDYVNNASLSDRFYNASDFTSISIINNDDTHPGNTPEREAFRGNVSADIPKVDPGLEQETDIYAELERPLARFRFIATDAEKFLSKLKPRSTGPDNIAQQVPKLEDYKTVVRYTSYMPSVYNLFLDRPVDSSIGQWFNGKMVSLPDQTVELGHDYVFVNHRESSVQVSLETYDSYTGELVAQTPPITVPLLRGHVTEVRGAFLSSKVQGGMGVNPDFDGEYNIEIH